MLTVDFQVAAVLVSLAAQDEVVGGLDLEVVSLILILKMTPNVNVIFCEWSVFIRAFNSQCL